MFMSDISIIVRKMRLIAEANLEEFDLGFPEQLVIMYLSAHGPSNQAAIAEKLEIDKGSITKTLAKLESKNLVNRKDNPANRREKQVELGPAADEIVAAMRSEHKKLDDLMFEGLSNDEVEATSRALSTIADNLVKAEQSKRS